MSDDGLLNWSDYNWTSGSYFAVGDSRVADELPSIDKSIQGKPYISSSIDCYISATYMSKSGTTPKTIEIKKRYNISVRYANSTLMSTIQEVRTQIQREFHKKYPKFQITSIFLPELSPIVPVQPIQFQMGSKMYRELMEAGKYSALMKLRQKIHIKYIKDMYNIDQLIVGKYRKK